MVAQINTRLGFIDFTRGIIMAIMAWDHVAGFWYAQHFGSEGLGGRFPYLGADLVPFLARFVTHFCAPTFFFLSGVSLALSTERKLRNGVGQREISLHLIKRGGVLFLIALFIEGNAFGLSPLYFGVLGCFGACFIIFSVYRRLPWQLILAVSSAIVLFHPFLDLSFLGDTGIWPVFRAILHEPNIETLYPIQVLYPIIPWIGVMGLGWCVGLYINRLEFGQVMKLVRPVTLTGVVSLLAFVAFRWFGSGFVNLVPRVGNTLEDWLAVSKYPPDLAFLTLTLGGMCLILAFGLVLEVRGRLKFIGVVGAILAFGQAPLFFYAVHLVLYRVRPFFMTRPLTYVSLDIVFVIWVVGLVILWRLCLRFIKLKREHPTSLLQYI